MNIIRLALALLPGWNSLEAVDKLSTFFSWFAIIGGLGILMVLEVVAHIYAGRKEELVEIAHAKGISTLKSEHADAIQKLVIKTEKAVQDSVAHKIAAVSAPRGIDSTRQGTMKAILSPFKGSPIKISAYNSNPESVKFARILGDIFKSSGWKVEGPVIGLSGTGPPGVWIQAPPSDPKAASSVDLKRQGDVEMKDLPSPIKQVVAALNSGGVQDLNYAEISSLEAGALELYVGAKIIH